MSDDYTSYQVPGQQLRYRVAQLNAAGIPFNVVGQQGGVYVIVIPMAYASGMDNLPQPQRRRKPWWMPSRKGLVTLAMLAVVAAGVYMVFSGGITIKGVDVPKVELPKIDAPAAEVSRTVDAAKSAAMTFVWALGGLIAIGGIYALCRPLMAAGRLLGKAVRREQ